MPFGTYSIQATYKENFTKKARAILKHIKDEKCAQRDFYYLEGGSIKGRIVDTEGKPVAGLQVYAERLAFSPEDKNSTGLYDGSTDENGNYEIEGLQKGKYILGINYNIPISNSFPFPATYYPNVNTADKAANIVVTAEKALTGFNIQLPPKLKIRLVTGTALFTNGKPIAEGKIKVEEEKSGQIIDNAEIDKEGRFNLSVVEGQGYYLHVYKAWNIIRESKKVYIPKTGEIEPLEIIIHPLQ